VWYDEKTLSRAKMRRCGDKANCCGKTVCLVLLSRRYKVKELAKSSSSKYKKTAKSNT
jgi:hypothetical protein